MSIGESTEDPVALLDAFLGGEKEAGKKLKDGISSEQFSVKLLQANGLRKLLENKDKVDRAMVGVILLRLSSLDFNSVAQSLIDSLASNFDDLSSYFLDGGSEGIEALTNILVKPWKDTKNREDILRKAIPQLAKRLQQTKEETTQVALLNSLIRIFSINPQLFKPSSGAIPFGIYLDLLSNLIPQSVRSRVIVLLSNIISSEAADSIILSTLRSQLSDFINTTFSKSTPTDYITAFSVLTSIFTIKSEIGAEVFQQDGFLEEALEDPMDIEDDRRIITSFLELLSAAAVDKNCRAQISKLAEGLLKECTQSDNTEIRALAGAVQAKLAGGKAEQESSVDMLKVFKDAFKAKNESALLSAVEGLAFASTIPATKERLVKDTDFLPSLLSVLKSPGQSHPLAYGCLSIIVNLTYYQPPLSEEQKRINDIKRLAKDSDVNTIDELDKDNYVATRCKTILAAGLLPALNAMATNSSPACITAISRILISVSTPAAHGGLLAHQGAIKLILTLLNKQVDPQTELTFSHAMAKILITVNPSLVFSSRTPITAPINYLVTILTNESLPTELPRFEALLALTNLASADNSARNAIVEKAWTVIETLLLNDHALIQRATTELVCNLVVSDKGAEKFIPSTTNTSATSRLHLLLALADVEDVATRRAAGGALAMLTDFKEICMALKEVERGLQRVVSIVGDQDDGVAFRGVICAGNMVRNGDQEMKKEFLGLGLANGILELVQKSSDESIKQACLEIAQLLR